MSVPTLIGITAKTISSDRIKTRVLFAGDESGTPVIFVHGNVSSATFWEQAMLDLPDGFYGIAPDQRGYGDADADKHLDATRGMADMSDDLIELMNTLGIEKAHFVAHSAGGSTMWQFLIDASERVLSLTQVAPGSPFGFGGTKGLDGELVSADGAGTGAAGANPQFVQSMKNGERDAGETTARTTMNTFYWKPPFIAEREEDFLSSMLSTHLGDKDYPGDAAASENWPQVAPGKWGILNALAPIYQPDINQLYAINPKPPILWIRGDSDQIVANESLFDLATYGKLGAIPGYPGEDVCPPQPMIDQTRAVLDKYQNVGGSYTEVVFEDVGHTPYIEKSEQFNNHFHEILKAN